MKDIVITIGREYGSGGRYIGEEVAKRLNIPFYDKKIIEKTAKDNTVDYKMLEKYDEKSKSRLANSFDMLAFQSQEEMYSDVYIQKLIEKTIKDISYESCVILGRNASNILKDKNNILNIFIYSKDYDFKIKRKMEIDNISYEEAKKRLKKIDKRRKKFYENLNKNHVWGDKSNYDYCIDSSVLGIEKTIDLIIYIYNSLKEGD